MSKVKIPVVRGAILAWAKDTEANKGKRRVGYVGKNGCPHAITTWHTGDDEYAKPTPEVTHCRLRMPHDKHSARGKVWV